MKPKTCKECKTPFFPQRPMQAVCGPSCGLSKARKDRERKAAKEAAAERKADREKKDRLKSKSDWAKEAQQAVNALVRERDKDLPCISCGRHHQGQYHAGHYLSVGAKPELRFELLNIHKQCSACNNYLSGNAIQYRIGLIQKIGLDRVEWLEGPHDLPKHTVEQLVAIRDDARAKLKELRKLESYE